MAPVRLIMEICCRGCPPAEVKSPSTRSSVPSGLSCWLYTPVAFFRTPG